MTMQVYLVEVGCWLGGTSGSAVAVGTGLRSFTLADGAPVPVPGMTLRVERAAAAGTYMTGIVVAANEAGFTMQVQATGGSGTHSDWVCTAGTLRFSSGQGMTTSGADTPPHVRFDPRLRQALEIRRDMFDRGTTGGRSRIEYGELVLANPDGAYDRLLDYGFDARRVTVRVGQEGAPFPAAFPVVLVCTAERIIGEGATLTLRLRTRQAELDRPIQRNRYGGTNSLPDGLDGTPDDLQGRARPLVFGQVANITPMQVNSARLIWQVNDGPVQDIPAVYDGAFPLTRGADYADQADMEANPPASGTYRAWLGGGYFALGDSPAGEVTADAVQGASAADRSIARLVAAIVTGPGEIDPGDVVTADIDAMHAAFPAEVCCYVAEDRSIADVLDDLCASGGMWWGFDRLGLFRMGRLVAPAGDPAVTFRRFGGGVVAEAANDADIISSELLAPQDPGAGLPVRSVVVRYARNWTPQTTGINGGVSDARRAWLAEPYRATAPAEDAAVAAKHPLAEDLVIDTLLVHAADAAAERDRQLALRSVRRDRLRIRSRLDADLLAAVDVGAVVRVVQPRWRCDAGRLFVVIGPAIDARISGLDVVVWG